MGWTEGWVVVDVETTGLSSKRDRIIEIGAVAGKGGTVTGEFHSLIDAGCPIHWQAQRAHGITDEMLFGQPRPEKVFREFYRFLGQSSLVAHNAPFDVGFLRHEFGRLGLGLTNRRYCTLRLSRQGFRDCRTIGWRRFFDILAGLSIIRCVGIGHWMMRGWRRLFGGC